MYLFPASSAKSVAMLRSPFSPRIALMTRIASPFGLVVRTPGLNKDKQRSRSNSLTAAPPVPA